METRQGKPLTHPYQFVAAWLLIGSGLSDTTGEGHLHLVS